MQRRFDTARATWEWVTQYEHQDGAWLEIIAGREDDAVRLTSSFDPGSYLGAGTVLQRGVSGMPLDPDSEAMAAYMAAATPFAPAGGWGQPTGLNTSSFGTQPIHMYVVDSTHPACTFQEWEGSAVQTPPLEVETYLSGRIPHASWMVPAQNGDQGMAIYDVGTGIMREYFMVQQDETTGVWSGGGGYSLASPGLQNLAAENYGLQQRRGISNVAGMHNSLGFISIGEALAGRIDHALCFTAASLRMTRDDGTPLVSWPARAADGKLERYMPGGAQYAAGRRWEGDTVTPTHGQWGRLAADVDPEWNPITKRPYHAFTRLVIEAAKTWGIVATDTNLFCHAFNAEQGRTFDHVYGADPWANGGIIRAKYARADGGDALDLSEFPWHRTEWAPVDWGRPVPDMNLRPGQLAPWLG